jgi:uncharacterized protein YebE (UPF0316 family)
MTAGADEKGKRQKAFIFSEPRKRIFTGIWIRQLGEQSNGP